jgi:hypothetical protein
MVPYCTVAHWALDTGHRAGLYLLVMIITAWWRFFPSLSHVTTFSQFHDDCERALSFLLQDSRIRNHHENSRFHIVHEGTLPTITYHLLLFRRGLGIHEVHVVDHIRGILFVMMIVHDGGYVLNT